MSFSLTLPLLQPVLSLGEALGASPIHRILLEDRKLGSPEEGPPTIPLQGFIGGGRIQVEVAAPAALSAGVLPGGHFLRAQTTREGMHPAIGQLYWWCHPWFAFFFCLLGETLTFLSISFLFCKQK